MRGVGQTLAGRVAVLHLDPLSAAETAEAAALPDLSLLPEAGGAPAAPRPLPDLGDWLLRGGYPEPRLHPSVDRALWMESYIQTYLERDLRSLEQVSDLESFRAFFSLVCAATGQVLNLARLGRDAGISAPTARRWLRLLTTSRLVALLPPSTGISASASARARRSMSSIPASPVGHSGIGTATRSSAARRSVR